MLLVRTRFHEVQRRCIFLVLICVPGNDIRVESDSVPENIGMYELNCVPGDDMGQALICTCRLHCFVGDDKRLSGSSE